METILVPLDGSPLSERALPLAASLAHDLGMRLRLLHAKEPSVAFDTEQDLQASFHATKWRVQQLYGYEPEGRTRLGPAAHVIVEEAGDEDVGFVVMASHSREALLRSVLGSVAEQVADVAPVPVFLVPASVDAPGLVRINRILLPLDGSEQAGAILRPVNRFARLLRAEVEVLRVFEPVAERGGARPRTLAGTGQVVDGVTPEELAKLRAPERRRPKTIERFELGDPASRIAAACHRERADLVAFATYGRTSLDRDRLSRVAEAVLRHSRLPLMVFGREALRRLAAERNRPALKAPGRARKSPAKTGVRAGPGAQR